MKSNSNSARWKNSSIIVLKYTFRITEISFKRMVEMLREKCWNIIYLIIYRLVYCFLVNFGWIILVTTGCEWLILWFSWNYESQSVHTLSSFWWKLNLRWYIRYLVHADLSPFLLFSNKSSEKNSRHQWLWATYFLNSL